MANFDQYLDNDDDPQTLDLTFTVMPEGAPVVTWQEAKRPGPITAALQRIADRGIVAMF